MEKDLSEIEEIKFGIYSSDEIRKLAVCKIDSSKLCNNDKNSGYGTVYDPRMGTIENGKDCEVCGFSLWKCSGHWGYIELNEPIIHPLFYKQVVNFLKCFCIKCFKLLITEDQIILNSFNKISSVKRFNKILEKLEKIDICYNCSQLQPEIKYSINDNVISMVYKQKDKGKISIVLPVEEIKKIFDNIDDNDIKLLGFNTEMVHPKNLIMTVFPVIPTACRPYIISEGNICDDDLTIQIVEIIKANNHLEVVDGVPIQEAKKQKYLQSLKFRITTFYNNSCGRAKHTTNGRAIKGLKERLTGKDGIIRTNLMGKRCCLKGTKILLWNGDIKNVEDVKIGDILIGNDGEKRTVLKLFNGVDEMYKVKKKTGNEYIVNSEHILSFKFINNKKIYWKSSINSWSVEWFDKQNMVKKSKKLKVNKKLSKEKVYNEMKDFVNNLDDNNTLNICVKDYIKLPQKIKNLLYGYKLEKSVKWENKEVEIDPYIFGMWLGDGYKNGYGFASIDAELIDYWKKWADKNDMCVNLYLDNQNIHYGISKKINGKKPTVFKEKLKKYGVLNNKFIPKDYIINSKEVRLALLAGLIDTDGSVEQGGVTIRISQSLEHKAIIDDARFIADSLGFQTSIKEKNTSWKHDGVKKYGKGLILTISGYGAENIPTILPRKKCRSPLISGNNWTKITVEPYKVGEFYGFEIDGNNLFVLPDFTVLHNCEQTGRTVIGPDPTLKMNQLAVPEEIANNLTIPVQVTNFNYKYLTDLVNDGKVNYVLKDKGETKINLENALFFRGTRLIHGDIIIRKDESGNERELVVNNGKDMLKPGDRLKRNGEFITDIKYPEKRKYHLNIGDICERKLQDGDIVLLNRQPTQM